MNQITALLILCTFFVSYICQSQPSAYPTLNEQRAPLFARKLIKPTRLLDSIKIVSDLTFLSSEICEGRKPGTPGHERAAQRILSRMRTIGLDSFNNSLIAPFEGRTINGTTAGKNFIGFIKGTKNEKDFLVVSAHYDHVGKSAGITFFGADDNASGVACMLAMANYFKKNPPPYSIIFAAFDREETGLEGAMKYVDQLEKTNRLAGIKMNLNLDMVARSDSNELYVCGIKHNPSYKYVVEEVKHKTNALLLMGHDFGSFRNDWTKLSDQYAFHKKNIPFLYVSVEDHADYHKPTDTVERINLGRFIENCNTILLIAKAIKLKSGGK